MKTLILCLALAMPVAATAMPHDHHGGKPCEKDLSDRMQGKDKPCHHTKKHHKGHVKQMPHVMSMRPQTDMSPQTLEAMAANMKMHKAMDILFTGDADIDFLKGMIAHHQGAVDMAQIQLKYGKDSRVKRMARDVIRAQNLEIKWMEKWLENLESKKNGYQDSNWMGEHHSTLFE